MRSENVREPEDQPRLLCALMIAHRNGDGAAQAAFGALLGRSLDG
jgi:hypothetical protein